MQISRLMRIFLAHAVLVCSVSLGVWSQNLLLNGNFNKSAQGTPPGTPVVYTDWCEFGTSAAADWTIWVNSCDSNLSTVLVPSTLPNSTGYMMHVSTNGGANGIANTSFNSPGNTLSSIWVYINSGCVLIATGDGGNEILNEATCETGVWFHFSKVPNFGIPSNEFIVYSLFDTGADFYVKDASVVAAREN